MACPVHSGHCCPEGERRGQERRAKGAGRSSQRLLVGVRVDHQILRVGRPLLGLAAAAHHDIGLPLRGHELGLRGRLLAHEHHLVLPRVHRDHAVEPEELAADLPRDLLALGLLLQHVLDAELGLLRALVRVQDRDLRALQAREDVRLEGHGRAHRVVAVDHHEQHGVAVGQVGDREGPRVGLPDLEVHPVPDRERRRELPAALVRQRRLRHLGLPHEDVERRGEGVGVADPQHLLQLQAPDEGVRRHVLRPEGRAGRGHGEEQEGDEARHGLELLCGHLRYLLRCGSGPLCSQHRAGEHTFPLR
mmetsp:Transcript_73760/g.216129  ORF Transcript_73760/g.216129 Transcript_73760/m.216129 type:complete len:305 (-) Transcript_73760:95-1009(-)